MFYTNCERPQESRVNAFKVRHPRFVLKRRCKYNSILIPFRWIFQLISRVLKARICVTRGAVRTSASWRVCFYWLERSCTNDKAENRTMRQPLRQETVARSTERNIPQSADQHGVGCERPAPSSTTLCKCAVTASNGSLCMWNGAIAHLKL